MAIRTFAFTGALAIGLMATTSAQALIIDDFNSGNVSHSTGPMQDPGGSTSAATFPFPLPGAPGDIIDSDGIGDFAVTRDSNAVAPGAIGGFRDTAGYIQDIYTPGLTSIDVSVGGGVYNFGQNPGHYGHGWMQWDGNDADGAWDRDTTDFINDGTTVADFGFGPGDNNAVYFRNVTNGLSDGIAANGAGFDITEGGVNDQLEVDVINADRDPAAILFRFYDAGDFRLDRYVALQTLLPEVPPVGTFNLHFSTATLYDGGVAGGNPLDILSNTGAIVFHTHTLDDSSNHASLDLQIDEIRATNVSEPATLGLIGAGLLGLGVASRCRRKAA